MKHKLTHISDVFDAIERNEKEPEPGIPTGFKELDKATGGLRPGSMSVIAARPGMGKTALVLCIINHITKTSDKSVAFYSFGGFVNQLALRLLSIESNVDPRKLHLCKVSNDERKRVSEACHDLRNRAIYLHNHTIKFKKAFHTLKDLDNLGLVIFDDIDCLFYTGKKKQKARLCALISQIIKEMAKGLNVPIIVTSQISRKLEKRHDKRPTLDDFRKSSCNNLEPDADVIIFLYRDYYYNEGGDPNTAECIIAKNRYGEVLTVPLFWNDECGFFTDTYTQANRNEEDNDGNDF